jgi:hypothetical protein
MRARLYLHIATLGRHQKIVDEICRAIHQSGLARELEAVHVGILGDGMSL